MSALQPLEDKLDELLVKKAPVQLPENWRTWLATYAWVFALVGFIFGLLAIFLLLPALGFLSTVVYTGRWVFFAWVAALVLIGYVVLLGIATPKLKRLEKSGWDLIFYSAVFFIVYDVLNWLQYASFGSFFGLLWNLAWAVVGLYFIFQVRGHFVSGKKATADKKPAATTKKK